MILAERKPLAEIIELIGDARKVLVLGCGTCVTVCFAGGSKEVGILASQLRMAASKAGKELEVVEETIERQCEDEFFEGVKEKISDADVVLSLACGVGVQTIAELFPEVVPLPGVNTTSFGRPVEPGVFVEYCAGCGDCLLALTAGICPIARCSKSLLNGPCGGSENGRCEVDPENIPCAWHMIYERLEKLGRLDWLDKISEAKDWSSSASGGVRIDIREDLREIKLES
ncbi:MAG TPA: methylenetetrahydrofolate reductase C-terminal domain-containing protein [bacterium]|nr:methylenetetrahydrofolate reductase C-terminal domain-containing protein [bacterium]